MKSNDLSGIGVHCDHDNENAASVPGGMVWLLTSAVSLLSAERFDRQLAFNVLPFLGKYFNKKI